MHLWLLRIQLHLAACWCRSIFEHCEALDWNTSIIILVVAETLMDFVSKLSYGKASMTSRSATNVQPGQPYRTATQSWIQAIWPLSNSRDLNLSVFDGKSTSLFLSGDFFSGFETKQHINNIILQKNASMCFLWSFAKTSFAWNPTPSAWALDELKEMYCVWS